jgi:hypothetical protein
MYLIQYIMYIAELGNTPGSRRILSAPKMAPTAVGGYPGTDAGAPGTLLARADSLALRATRAISQQQTKQQKKVSK